MSERESMEVDVLYVGAGPANLASAYHLMKQVELHNNEAEANGVEPVEPPVVLIIEKAAEVGDHQLSGAVINMKAFGELMPDFVEQGFPTEYICDDAQFIAFTRKHTFKSPICPPMFDKRGYHIASLSNIAKWMAEKCEELGVWGQRLPTVLGRLPKEGGGSRHIGLIDTLVRVWGRTRRPTSGQWERDHRCQEI